MGNIPVVKFCPYCGSDKLKAGRGVFLDEWNAGPYFSSATPEN